MLVLTSDITIGNANFNFVNDIEIVSSWENLTDTARIVLPNNVRPKDRNGEVSYDITAGDNSLWKRGQPVELNLGYDGNNANIFSGVITKITPRKPLEFLCEDKMFILKQTTIDKFSKSGVTLKSLLSEIMPLANIGFETENITLGKFIISKASIAEVLDYLRKKFGLYSYFLPNGNLYVGFAYRIASIDEIATGQLTEFEFQKNIIDDSNLEYTRDDDVNLKVTAINIKPNNTRKSITVGDSLGENRVLHFYDVTDGELKRLATEALEKLKYEGFLGSFLTFLQPTVRQGNAVKMIDPLIPDRNGVYLVRKVVTRFGMGGGRQEITLDRKIS